MAVQAPDRPDSFIKQAAIEGYKDWLQWLAQLLDDRVWIGLVTFDLSKRQTPALCGYPSGKVSPSAALLLARKAHLSDKVLSVCVTGQPPNEALNKTDVKPPADAVLAEEPELTLLAIPLSRQSDKKSVLLLLGSAYRREQLSATIRLCRWASLWLKQDEGDVTGPNTVLPAGFDTQRVNTRKPMQNEAALLAQSVVQAIHQYGTPDAVSAAIANTLKQVYPCQRVSIAVLPAWKGRDAIQLTSVSDQVQIDRRKVLPGLLVAVMKERLAHGKATDESLKSAGHFPAAAELQRNHGGFHADIVSFPRSEGKLQDESIVRDTQLDATRAIALIEQVEWPGSTDQQAVLTQLLEPVLGVLVKLIDEQQSDWQKGFGRVRRWMRVEHYAGLNPKQWVAGVIAGLMLLALFIPVPLRITAKAAIVAKDLHVLIAPHSGFVSSAHVRAGDSVDKNQIMATLDTRDLQLAADKWRSEAIKNTQALTRALATRDRVEMGRLRADSKRILAEQTLIEHQLQRSQLRAPFAGVVLSGDLTQQLGSSVTQGDTLFTLAATDEFRLVLDVNEPDVGLVSTGQSVRVRMASLPDRTWMAQVEAVQPVATTTDDANVFRVPAQLLDSTEELRPGMEGIAKLYAGQQLLVKVYTRTLREKGRWLLWRLGLIR